MWPFTKKIPPLTEKDESLLLKACEEGNLVQAKKILKKYNDVEKTALVNPKFIVAAAKFTSADKSKAQNSAKLAGFLLEKGAAIDAVEEDSKNPLLMIALDKQDFNLIDVLASKLRSIKKEEKSKVLGIKNKSGHDVLLQAIANSAAAVKYFLDLGANPNTTYLGAYSPLYAATKKGDYETCKTLVDGGSKLSSADKALDILEIPVRDSKLDIFYLIFNLLIDDYEILLDGLNYALRDSAATNLLAVQLGQETIDFLQKFIPTQSLLKKMFSEEDSGGVISHNISDCKKITSKSFDEEDENKKWLLGALDILQSEQKICYRDKHSIEAIALPDYNHGAYCIIEYEDETPKTLHYCDGNLLLSHIDQQGHGYGIVSYDIRAAFVEKVIASGKDFSSSLKGLFKLESPVYYRSNETGEFNADIAILEKILEEVTVCSTDGRLQAKSQEILTQAQDRGNCSIKAVNIALRLILTRLDPNLKYEIDENGNPCGKGYDLFKKYKYSLIHSSLDVLLEATESNFFINKENPIYSLILYSLKSCFLHAASKGELSLMVRIKEILDEEQVDASKLKSSEGKSAIHIAAAHDNVKTFAWCMENKLFTQEETSDFFIHLSRNIDLLEVFLANSPNLSISDQQTINIAENLAKHSRNTQLEELLQKGLDPNTANLASWAMSLGNVDLIEKLLKHEKFDVNEAKDQDSLSVGFSILQWAIEERSRSVKDGDDGKTYLRITQTCLEKINPEEAFEFNSLLTRAAMNNDSEVAELLINKMTEIKPKIIDSDKRPGLNPMNLAIRNGNRFMVKLFRDYGIEAALTERNKEVTEKRMRELLEEPSPSPNLAPNNEKRAITLDLSGGIVAESTL